MAGDDILEDEDAAPVPELGVLPVLTPEARADILDKTTVIVLCGGEPSRVEEPLVAVTASHTEAIQRQGEGARSRLAAKVTKLQSRIEARLKLRDDLPEDLKRESDLKGEIGRLSDEASKVALDIRQRRGPELQQRLQDQLAQLDEDRKRAAEKLEDSASGYYRQRKETWDATAAERRDRALELKKDLQRAQSDADVASKRVSELSQHLITKTVAGFLVWLGYATVPATGAVLAMLLGTATVSFNWVFVVTHTFAAEMAGSSVQRFFKLVVFFGGCLAILLLSVWLVDEIVSQFDKNWRRKRGENSGVTIHLRPTQITRRSYVRLLASLPYILATCMVVAFIATPVNSAIPNELRDLAQTLTYTFIGTAIALLATATLMMYAVRIIEPRAKAAEHVVRGAWEFAVAPVAMIVAIAVAVSLPTTTGIRWGGWTLFMLLSSLSLAYGLVYHGVYKDADKAADEVEDIEAEIDALTLLQQPALPARALDQQMKITYEYARDTLRMERLYSRYRIPIRKKTDFDTNGSAIDRRHWWTSLIPTGARRKFEPIELSLDELDEEISPDLVQQLRSLTRQKADAEAEHEKLKVTIAEKERLTSILEVESLEDQLANRKGEHDQLAAYEATYRALAEKEMHAFAIDVTAAVLSAKRLRNAFEDAASPNHGSDTPPPSPGPRLLPPGENDDQHG